MRSEDGAGKETPEMALPSEGGHVLVVGLLGIRIFEIGFEVEKGQCVTKALVIPPEKNTHQK